MLGSKDDVLTLVNDRDLGESGGVAVGLARKSEEVRLVVEGPSASGEDLRGA